MKIIYRSHLRLRIKERGFPNEYPRKIYKQAKRHYFDIQTGHYVAVARLRYAGKLRNLVISYDIIDEAVEIITIHPTTSNEIKRREITGRWRRHEKSKK